jgi:RNA polymerase sigma factor for flagellar operon FliA
MLKEQATDLDRLWMAYKKNNTNELRNEIILKYIPLVKQVVNRMGIQYKASIDIDDLLSYGTLGLIDAINKYDNKKGVKFETYAAFRIRGAIIDQLRKLDWVPRSIREKTKKVQEAALRLEQEYNRQPTDIELAQYLSISVDHLRRTLSEIHSLIILSLEEQVVSAVDDSSQHAFESHYPEDSLIVNEVKKILADAIDKLTEKEKKVIALH